MPMFNKKILAVFLSFSAIIATAAQSEDSKLFDSGAKPEVIADGFEFIEGPTPDGKGNIFFTDIPNNRIHRWSEKDGMSTVRENSGGANGLMLNAKGQLLAMEGTNQKVTAMNPDGSIEVVFERYNNKRLNSPNDLWIDNKGGFYFTDPRYGFSTHEKEQPMEGVYYVSADYKTITRVVEDMQKPNGIVGTEDGKTLYVADTYLMRIFKFDVKSDGTLGPKKEFIKQGSDGMTLDEHGNLYLTWASGLSIYDPDGKLIERFKLHATPANVTFGGPDGKNVYVTAVDKLYRLKMNVTGQAANR